MANENQVTLLKGGVNGWNRWRKEHTQVNVDLSNTDLNSAYLDGANLTKANLNGVDLSRANLTDANLKGAIIRGANLKGATLRGANLSMTDLHGSDLNAAELNNANLNDANLDYINLSNADLANACLKHSSLYEAFLNGAFLFGASLNGAFLNGANLKGANLENADLRGIWLNGAKLNNAKLNGANLKGANLNSADLSCANLNGVDLRHADLRGANISGVDLQCANLVETDLDQATLTNCKLYGISVWNIKGTLKTQSNLIITPDNEAEITVDDLQVAQFIYLLLINKNVRNVIDTITSKAVLILGRFTPDRKEVLDLIREELHKHDYVPILFDFENTKNQSLLETVMTLAGMAKFIVADITAATMVREELRSIVEKYPAKPIQPIMLNGEKEYITLPEMFRDFKNILKTFVYVNKKDIVSGLSIGIIKPAENWLAARNAQDLIGSKTERELELEKENEALRGLLQKRNA